MGDNFVIEVDEKEVLGWLVSAEKKQMPYATARGLTDVAFHAMKVEQRYMKKVFKNPVAYTVKGVLVKKANKKDIPIHSIVYLRDDAQGKGTSPAKYLEAPIQGTSRSLKKFEAWLRGNGHLREGWFVVPSKHMKLNKSGNVTRASLNKMFDALEAGETDKFFVTRKDTKGTAGVYKRMKKGVRPQLIFVKGAPAYKQSFPFHDVALKIAQRTAGKAIGKRFEDAMRTAKR